MVYDCQTGFTKFQSTLPAWGATHHSISRFIYNDFNPRSPQGERRNQEPVDIVTITFQSTLPAWGATRGGKRDWRCYRHFNPRSPQGERQASGKSPVTRTLFQSTLPAGGATLGYAYILPFKQFQSTLPAGGATNEMRVAVLVILFQSTLPAGGATAIDATIIKTRAISIHAPRRGSDSYQAMT